MNTQTITLPELGDERIDAIEAALFSQIARERRDALAEAERARQKAARRGRIWMGAAAAAAFVAVAAIIASQLSTGGADTATVAEQPAVMMEDGSALELMSSDSSAAGARDVAGADLAAGDREIVATASATVQVDDTEKAAQAIGDAAVAAGGYVESMSIGGTVVLDDTMGRVAPDEYVTTYPASSGAWITVRVPAERLTDAVADLSEVGDVTATQIDRRDVTTEAVDLRARVTALEASVARLTELMGQATSTADLISAESALAQRQSELDSLRQQLTWLESQVGMSTLTVSLTVPAPAVTADPAGFGDGIVAGWNGLVATLNGLVVAIGFLLPWVAVLAVAGIVVWGVRRLVRTRRAARAAATPDTHESSPEH